MPKYKLLTAYDGTHYGGWQIQPNSTSIQELIQNALKTVLREEILLVGSGRTDAGVHARGQTAHFTVEKEINPYRLLASLNGLLPDAIRILSIEKTDATFHARYSARGKVYHYHLHLERFQNPFKRLYSAHILFKVDVAKMQEGAQIFLGAHDFTSFANQAHLGAAAHNPIKTLRRLELIEEPGGVRLEFEADGFLYKMVRNIVGTLLEVGKGKRKPEEISLLFEAKDRRKADAAAPPCGLFLHSVLY
jgi:tRNA pseudouridine38-40 synthase